MRNFKFLSIFWIIASLSVMVACENTANDNINAFEEDAIDQLTATLNESALTDDLSKFVDFGIDLADVDAIFSVGWQSFYHPFNQEEVNRSDAFAVANPDTAKGPRFLSGQDMGSVFLHYSGNSLEFSKVELRNGGVIYRLGSMVPGGPRGRRHGGRGGFSPGNNGVRPGRPGNNGGPQGGFGPGGRGPFGPPNSFETVIEIPFLPGETYRFEATGSDNFAAVTVAVVAPQKMLQITSPAQNGTIASDQDLKVTWEGGDSNQPISIGIMPLIERDPNQRPGPRDGSKDRLEPQGRLILETNTGEYTIPAAEIQSLASESNVAGILVQVMQMNPQKIDEDDSTYLVHLRMGDQVIVKFD